MVTFRKQIVNRVLTAPSSGLWREHDAAVDNPGLEALDYGADALARPRPWPSAPAAAAIASARCRRVPAIEPRTVMRFEGSVEDGRPGRRPAAARQG
jgi:hypothetical protein